VKSNAARIWAVVAAIVVVLIIVYVARHRGSSQPAAARPDVKTTVVKNGVFLVHVNAHGRVGPPPGSSAALTFAVAGRLTSVLVHVGDQVGPGQGLAQLDATPFELAVAQARGDAQAAAGSYGGGSAAAVQSAEAKLAVAKMNLQRLLSGSAVAQSDQITAMAAARQADLKVHADEQNLQRTKTLYGAGIAAARDVQAAQNQLAADLADAQAAHARARAARAGASGSVVQARADYAQAQTDLLIAQGGAMRAQALLAEAERNLANTTLRAPSDGIVVAILKHPGESVDTTTPVVQVGVSYSHAATLSVSATQARSIKVGDAVQLHISRSQQSFSGRVIAAVPVVDPTTQQATVVVNGVPAGAVAGDAVDASIVTDSRNGIIVPTSAIVQDPQTGDTLVFVASTVNGQQQFTPRKVQVGPGDQTSTQIMSGLRGGELIAAEGAYDLLAPATG